MVTTESEVQLGASSVDFRQDFTDLLSERPLRSIPLEYELKRFATLLPEDGVLLKKRGVIDRLTGNDVELYYPVRDLVGNTLEAGLITERFVEHGKSKYTAFDQRDAMVLRLLLGTGREDLKWRDRGYIDFEGTRQMRLEQLGDHPLASWLALPERPPAATPVSPESPVNGDLKAKTPRRRTPWSKERPGGAIADEDLSDSMDNRTHAAIRDAIVLRNRRIGSQVDVWAEVPSVPELSPEEGEMVRAIEASQREQRFGVPRLTEELEAVFYGPWSRIHIDSALRKMLLGEREVSDLMHPLTTQAVRFAAWVGGGKDPERFELWPKKTRETGAQMRQALVEVSYQMAEKELALPEVKELNATITLQTLIKERRGK